MYFSKIETAADLSVTYTSNFSIKYVLQGEEQYTLDGKRHTPKAGQYLIINDEREVETQPVQGSVGISVFLDKTLIAEAYHALTHTDETLLDQGHSLSPLPNPEFFEHPLAHHDLLGDALKSLAAPIVANPQAAQTLHKETYYLMAEMVVRSQKQVTDSISRITRVKKSTRDELYRMALLAREYLREHATEECNLDALSQYVGLSKYHLIHVFRSAFGQTPYQYYLHCKVHRAQEYLRHGALSQGEIAALCGFNDVYAFSKTFKKLTGTTPSAFRTGW
ncbi:MAG: helix-turn-helix transcriptional regulator [Bacteroidota bacterium]